MRSFILPGAIFAALVLSTLAAGAEENSCKPVGTTQSVCRCTCTASDASGKKISQRQDVSDTSPGRCGINRGWVCDIKTGEGTVRGKYDNCAPEEVKQGKAGSAHGLTARPDKVLQPPAGGKPPRHGLRPGISSHRAAPPPSVPGKPGTTQLPVCCKLPSGYDLMAQEACRKSGGFVVSKNFCRDSAGRR